MDAFQTFRRVFYFWGDPIMEELPLENIKEKLQVYAQAGYDTSEKREQYRQLRNRMTKAYVDTGLKTAKFFEIDKVEKRLMLLTDSPKNPKLLNLVKLPYPVVFLDVDIDMSEVSETLANWGFDKIIGILIMRITSTDNPMVKSWVEYSTKDLGGDKYLYCAFAYKSSKTDTMGVYDLMIPITHTDTTKDIVYDKPAQALVNFFRNFVINFSLFITHPEVEVVEFERTRDSNARRVNNGKMALPSSNRIRLTGKIKRYAYHYRNSLGDGFDFRFWVRGFWRFYRSEKFKNMKGKALWIEPFLKGTGELRDSVYSVESNSEDKQEYKDKFLFLDDIKPLDNPLNTLSLKERRKVMRV